MTVPDDGASCEDSIEVGAPDVFSEALEEEIHIQNVSYGGSFTTCTMNCRKTFLNPRQRIYKCVIDNTLVTFYFNKILFELYCGLQLKNRELKKLQRTKDYQNIRMSDSLKLRFGSVRRLGKR